MEKVCYLLSKHNKSFSFLWSHLLSASQDLSPAIFPKSPMNFSSHPTWASITTTQPKVTYGLYYTRTTDKLSVLTVNLSGAGNRNALLSRFLWCYSCLVFHLPHWLVLFLWRTTCCSQPRTLTVTITSSQLLDDLKYSHDLKQHRCFNAPKALHNYRFFKSNLAPRDLLLLIFFLSLPFTHTHAHTLTPSSSLCSTSPYLSQWQNHSHNCWDQWP